MPSLNRNEKVECNVCKQLITKKHISRHRQRCNSGTFKCSKCNFYAKSQKDLDYHMAKAHAPAGKKIDTTCGTCGKHFASYYSLQQHRKKEHGTFSKVSTSSSQIMPKNLNQKKLLSYRKNLVRVSTSSRTPNFKMADTEFSISSWTNWIQTRSMLSSKTFTKN